MSDVELMFPDSDTTCSKCYAEFLDPDDLAVHVSQVHKEETPSKFVGCQFCTVYLSDLENYALHIRDVHIPGLNCCKYCHRIFSDADQYRKHESKHYTYVPKSMYSCSHCDKLYNNVLELQTHEFKHHHNSHEGVFLSCMPFLSSLLNIKALKFLQSLNDEVCYICVNCEMTTPDVGEYINHLKVNNCKSLACDGCSSVYRTKKTLIKHFQSHKECYHNSRPVSKQCLECCKMFELKLWREHTKTCRPFKCRICNIIYSTFNKLAIHQSEQHPSTVVLKECKYCHKELAGPVALSRHIERSHRDLDQYKYNCIHCDALFKHPKNLFTHFSSTHKDIEPYTCRICDKKFKVRKRFTIHIKLDHKSIGYVEFDENNHVFFTDKKSEKPIVTDTSVSEQLDSVANEMIKDNNMDFKTSNNSEPVIETTNTVSITLEPQNNVKNESQNVPQDSKSAEAEPLLITKEKQSRKRCKAINDNINLDSSDDEPLKELQKRAKKKRRAKLKYATWNRKKEENLRNNKKRFICNICKKYCYTFQNYHNHYSTHYANATLKCVKCSKTFKSKDDLNKHCAEDHPTAQLTQTLKSLLEKRKNGTVTNITTAERFQQTIKSVDMPPSTAKVTITTVNQNQSVKNFIESFTPEDAPKNDNILEKRNSISLTPFIGKVRSPMIKMTKCNLTPEVYTDSKLCLPVHFRQVVGETHKITIKEVFLEPSPDVHHFSDADDDDMDKSEPVPEVAQEIMLEETEEIPPKALYIPHKVVLPKLPKEFNKVRIAHLQAEAPYYKIVKVMDVLNPKEKPVQKPVLSMPKKDIQLPDGTKLVTVNPLAHLLGDKPMDKILANMRSKHYQPKTKDFEMAIANAMLKLENPNAFAKKKRKKGDTEKPL